MDIRAAGEAFEVALATAELEVLIGLVETLGDEGEDCTFHWSGELSPTRERIVERVSAELPDPTRLSFADAREVETLGQMFLHGAKELDDDFEIITGWPPAIARNAADDVTRALGRPEQ